MPIVVDRDDDSDLRLRLVRLLGMYPVRLVARLVRHARQRDSPNVAVKHSFSSEPGPLYEEALLPAPVGAGRFVIRATRERGVGVPSSRSLSTASREASPFYGFNRHSLRLRQLRRSGSRSYRLVQSQYRAHLEPQVKAWKSIRAASTISHRETATIMTTDTTSGEMLTYAQAGQRLNLGVLDVRRMVRTEQCPVVLDSRGRRRITAAWVEDSQGWLNGTVADVRTGDSSAENTQGSGPLYFVP